MAKQTFTNIALLVFGIILSMTPAARSMAKIAASNVANGHSEMPEVTKNANANQVNTSKTSLQDDALQVVNDPNQTNTSIKVSETSKAFIKKNLMPKLKEIWSDKVCAENFKIIAAANGSFTKSGGVQTAYLYEYCQLDGTLVKDGIAVFEGSTLVENIVFSSPEVGDENIVFDNGYATDLSNLRDIDKNGLDELVISYGYVGGGAFFSSIDIVEVANKTVNVIGSTEIYIHNWEGGNGYRITVKNGKPPVFYSETYQQKVDNFVKTKSSKPFKLSKHTENKYELVS